MHNNISVLAVYSWKFPCNKHHNFHRWETTVYHLSNMLQHYFLLCLKVSSTYYQCVYLQIRSIPPYQCYIFHCLHCHQVISEQIQDLINSLLMLNILFSNTSWAQINTFTKHLTLANSQVLLSQLWLGLPKTMPISNLVVFN